MTPHDRAVAWLDAHPGIVEAGARAVRQENHLNPLSWPEFRGDARAALVAFLTSPLPCANPACVEGKIPGCHGNCPHCHGDGTVGILLDQLERDTNG